jgi:DNA-binding transcriptional ArsR family regulator
MDDDQVFKALADPTRRHLLDRLFERDGRTLTELESELEMTRFGVMKHLRVLEDAGLVVTRREGREKLHFLNPVPIRLIHDRWIDKYTEHRVAALADLKHELEETHDHDDRTDHAGLLRLHPRHPEQIWDAITKPEFTQQYFYGAASTSRDGRRFSAIAS